MTPFLFKWTINTFDMPAVTLDLLTSSTLTIIFKISQFFAKKATVILIFFFIIRTQHYSEMYYSKILDIIVDRDLCKYKNMRFKNYLTSE